MTIPETSLQSLACSGSWWMKDEGCTLVRGRLLRAFVCHVHQQPMELVAEGRKDATNHHTANYEVRELRLSESRKTSRLPVGALPERSKERRIVQRAKHRPVLLLADPCPEVPRAMRGTQQSRWQTAPTLTVAPYYGADQTGSRGGFPPEFVQRIWGCEYQQYMCDCLPIGRATTTTSILRLDHMMPIGRGRDTYEITPHRLRDDVLSILDEWLVWFQTGLLPEDGVIDMVRTAAKENA